MTLNKKISEIINTNISIPTVCEWTREPQARPSSRICSLALFALFRLIDCVATSLQTLRLRGGARDGCSGVAWRGAAWRQPAALICQMGAFPLYGRVCCAHILYSRVCDSKPHQLTSHLSAHLKIIIMKKGLFSGAHEDFTIKIKFALTADRFDSEEKTYLRKKTLSLRLYKVHTFPRK